MKNISFLILRIGVGITFIWIGFMILEAPEAWGSMMSPWAAALLPVPIKEVMIGNGILDIVIGLSLVTGVFLWIGGILGAVHLVMVMVVSGIDNTTVRDIGLMAACMAIAINSLPDSISKRFYFLKKR